MEGGSKGVRPGGRKIKQETVVQRLLSNKLWLGMTYGIRGAAEDTGGKAHNWVTEKGKEREAREELTDLVGQLWFALSKLCFQILAKQDEKVYSKLPSEKDKNLHIAKLKIKIDVIPNA